MGHTQSRASWIIVAAILSLTLSGCAQLNSLSGSRKRQQSSARDSSINKILPILIQSLQHENADTRFKSVEALEAIGPDAAAAAPDLVFLLDDPVQKVREGSASALLKMGPNAVDALIPAANDTRYPRIRREVFPVLAKMGADAKPALSALRNASQDPDTEIRSRAIAALNIISKASGIQEASPQEEKLKKSLEPAAASETAQSPPAVKVAEVVSVSQLLQYLKNPDADVRTQAVEALEFKKASIGEILPVLIHIALNDSEASVRLSAVRKLKGMGTQPVSALILALRHKDPKVRGNAVEALGILGPVSKIILPSLVETLADVKISQRTVFALAGIGQASVPFLIKALYDDAVYSAASDALVRIGRKAAPALTKALDDEAIGQRAEDALSAIGQPAVPALIASLKDRASPPRSKTLVRIGRPAVAPLIKAMRTREEKIRQGSGLTLCQMGPAAADAAGVFFEILKEYPDETDLYPIWRFGHAGTSAFIEAAREKHADTRLLAIETLARLKPAPEDAYLVFIDSLHDSDTRIGDFGVVMIKDLGASIVPALIEGLKSPSKDTARSSAEALGFIGDPAKKAVGALREALVRNTDTGVRKRSAYALGALGKSAKSAVPDLITVLEDDPIRWWASEALRKIGSNSIPALARSLRKKDSGSRFYAAILLNRLDPENEKAPPVLLNALQAENAGVRYHAALALGSNARIADEAVPLLILALKDSDAGVRFASAYSLGQLGTPAVNPLLLAAINTHSPLSHGASAALNMLDGSSAPELVRALKNKKTRSLSSEILFKMGPRSVPALVEKLSSKGPRSPVGRILLRLGNAAVPSLIQALQEGRDSLRKGAELTLKEIGTPEALAAL